MTGKGPIPDGAEATRPSVARVYDFLLGGHHNFAVDREFGRKLIEAEPNAREIVAENRAFLGRSVRHQVAAGIRQFIDLGSGIPTQRNVHEIAQAADPAARVVYVDNDPVAVAHSRHILRGNPGAAVIGEDMRDPEAILAHPDLRGLIDLAEPVGLLFVSVLHFLPDSDDPAGLVGGFARRLAPGSHVTISHVTHEPLPGTAAEVVKLYQRTTNPARTRTRGEILALFSGFELIEPGLVLMPLWRPDGPAPEHPERCWYYAGVGRKPAPQGTLRPLAR